MPGIVIRKVNDADYNSILDIFNYYVKEGFAAYPDTPVSPGFVEVLIDGTHACVIMENDDKVIGFCILRPLLPFTTFANTATVSTFIEHSSRYKGYGKILLEQVEKEARAHHIRLLLASISSENKESLIFHGNNGFLECGRFHNAGCKFSTPFDLVWMEKKLE